MKNYFIKSYNIKAFTLAEVLITLLIIGVIASIVVPNLINDSKKAEYVTKLQKEYAVLQQAYKLIILDNGGSILNDPNFNCSGTCGGTKSANAMSEFAEKINVIKNCGTSSGCWYDTPRYFLGGEENVPNLEEYWGNKYGKATLNDGSLMMVYIYNENCATSYGTAGNPLYESVCGELHIDVNGSAKPNQIGRDHFYFWITKNGILPQGMSGDNMSCIIGSIITTTSKGCTNKVLSKGEMTY